MFAVSDSASAKPGRFCVSRGSCLQFWFFSPGNRLASTSRGSAEEATIWRPFMCSLHRQLGHKKKAHWENSMTSCPQAPDAISAAHNKTLLFTLTKILTACSTSTGLRLLASLPCRWTNVETLYCHLVVPSLNCRSYTMRSFKNILRSLPYGAD